jgi:hypothetical protein
MSEQIETVGCGRSILTGHSRKGNILVAICLAVEEWPRNPSR